MRHLREGRRWLPIILVALAFQSGLASARPPVERRPDAPSLKKLARTSRDAIVGLDPYLERIFDRANQLGQEEITSHRSIGDLTGDGVTDVVVDQWTISWDPTGTLFLPNGSYRATILDGSDGKKLFIHDAVFVDGWAGLSALRIGPEGEPGLVAAESNAFSTAYSVRLTGLTGEGEQLWTTLLPSTYNWNTGDRWTLPVGVATDALVAFDRIDVKPGKAGDILIGQADYLLPPRTKPIARTTVSILHGEDGSLTELPVSELSTEAIPMVDGVADLNGDASDDFVFLANSDSDNGHISAFDGRDGSAIWSTKYKMRPWSWADPIGNFLGDPTKDLMVQYDSRNTRVFAILDGKDGQIAWSQKALFPYVAGDIDRDGRPDIAGFHLIHGDDPKDVFLAFSNDGKNLYQVDHVPETSDCHRRFCFTFGFYLNAGDLNADNIRDTYVEQQTSWNRDVVSYITTGRTGQLLYDQHGLVPVKGAVDGRGDDVGVITSRKGRLSVKILDGNDLDALWEVQIEGKAAGKFADGWAPYGAATALNSDRCADIFIGVTGADALVLVALDGRDGSLLWQRAIAGTGRVSVDSIEHHTDRMSC